jgi:phosphatidylglycerophosphatase A
MPHTAVSPSFLFARPAHFVALGFGAGLAPVAAGTFGTLVAWPIAWALREAGSDGVYLAVTALVFAVGVWAADVTARDLGVADHGAIVVDEIAAFLFVLFFVEPTWIAELAAFVLFRLFDIVKPPPIREVDARVKGGFGVMADDVLAAGYTLLVLAIARRVIG